MQPKFKPGEIVTCALGPIGRRTLKAPKVIKILDKWAYTPFPFSAWIDLTNDDIMMVVDPSSFIWNSENDLPKSAVSIPVAIVLFGEHLVAVDPMVLRRPQ